MGATIGPGLTHCKLGVSAKNNIHEPMAKERLHLIDYKSELEKIAATRYLASASMAQML